MKATLPRLTRSRSSARQLGWTDPRGTRLPVPGFDLAGHKKGNGGARTSHLETLETAAAKIAENFMSSLSGSGSVGLGRELCGLAGGNGDLVAQARRDDVGVLADQRARCGLHGAARGRAEVTIDLELEAARKGCI